MKRLFMIFASLALFVGCSEEGTDTVIANSTIEITASTLKFDATGGAASDVASVTVTSSADWTLIGKQTEWCTPSALKGQSGSTITFAVAANDTEEARSTIYSVVCGNRNVKLTVVQSPVSEVDIIDGPQVYDVVDTESNLTIRLKSNVDYSFEVSDEAREWITPITSRSTSEEWIVVNIKANDTYAARSGVITIKAAGLEGYTITINQKQNNAVLVDKECYDLEAAGGTVTVVVRANVDFTLNIPAKYQTWISQKSSTESRSTGMVESVLQFDCTATDVLRLGKVYLNSGTIATLINIKQKSLSPVYGVFPDAAFAKYLVDNSYAVKVEGENKYELTGEAVALTTLSVSSKGIESFEGIESFVNLTSFDFRYNLVRTLDLSKNTKLTTINCAYSSLKELQLGDAPVINLNISNIKKYTGEAADPKCKVSGTKVENVTCNRTKVDEVDLTACPALRTVSCSGSTSAYLTTLVLAKAHEGVVTISKYADTVVEYK